MDHRPTPFGSSKRLLRMKTPTKRTHATFALDILRSDFKLFCYPLVRILVMLLLLVVMWPKMFDVSALAVANTINEAASAAVGEGLMNEKMSQAANDKIANDAKNVFEHMHLGWCLLFVVINIFVGVFSIGALTGQSLAVARSEQRGFGYGYVMALKRLPQLFIWWLVTVCVGVLLSGVRSIKYVGPLVAMLLGMAWGVLTFFSITAIMATGCGPIRAIGDSKQTIVDSWSKITGSDGTQSANYSRLRRGFTVGLPFVLLNLLALLLIFALLFIDFRTVTQGSHHISLGAIAALVIVLYTNGAIVAALWAIVKSTTYIWAKEGHLPESVDESVMEHAFVNPTNRLVESL